jgi:uncharacterized protein YfaP (DUF2135 family)
MKRIAVILAFSLVGVLAHAQKTLSGVQVSPHGAAMHSGTVQFSAACVYTDGSTDNCSGKTVSWYSSQPTLATVNSSGLASYVSNCGTATYGTPTYATAVFCFANIVATANGLSDFGLMLMQDPGDSIQVILTPGNMSAQAGAEGIAVANNLVVGATATFGAGMGNNGSLENPGNANPYPDCNWSSSNPSVGTINRYGFFTAVSVGTSVVSCATAGNATYSPAPATYTVTVIAGGAGGHTWYVRPDGGTPYTNATHTPAGQCNGLANAAYPGSGVDQPCAFGDFEDLYFDQVTHTQQWVISGGDTVIVYPKTGGYNTAIINPATSSPPNCGDYTNCDVPFVPSGTTAQPTRILGSNYASCNGSYGPNPAMTTLLLGYGRKLIDTSLTQNVDIECFEMADGSSTTGFQIGVTQSAFTSNATFKNLFIHNAVASGIWGASGLGIVVDHVHIRAALDTGYQMDDGFTTYGWGISNVSMAGGLTMTNSIIEFTGCSEIYGSTAEYPFIANDCVDEDHYNFAGKPGQGDGIGTGSMTGNWYYNNDIFRYNFQDGLDNLHAGAQSETVINSQAYGNDGQQFKIGSTSQQVIFQNDLAIANCNRIMQPFNGVTIAQSDVNPCRAGGSDIETEWAATGSYIFQNNTFIGVGNSIFSYHCDDSWASCATVNTVLQNNIFVGYTDNSMEDPQAYNYGELPWAFIIDDNTSAPIPANAGFATRSNNDFYNAQQYTPITTELVDDPLFIGEPPFLTVLTDSTESVLDNYNFMPSSGSPMRGAGIYISGLTTDANGVTRPDPPAIGALEAASGNMQSASQITLIATPNSVTVGQSITLSASVASVNGVMPTGTVIFTSNGTSVGSGVVNNAGTATLTVSFSAAGSDALTATYSGDATYAPGASPALSLTVNPAPAVATTTTLQASSNPVTAGQTVTLTATVVAPSGGTPSGTVSFLSNGIILGTDSVNGAGVATLSTASMAAGSYSITAQYGGNSSFDASTSSPLSETVNPATAVATTTTLQASSNPVTAGQAVTLTATVVAPSGGTPSGTVSFLSNGVILGTNSVNGAGVATLSTASMAAGSYSITAQYGGNSSFDASTSSPLSETVNPAPAVATTTLLQVSSNPITAGQAVTLTATVVAPSGGTPSGTVSFLSNGVILGTASLNSAGVATLSTASMVAGSYSLTAQYGGNSSFDASTSSPLSETVTAAGVAAGISVTASTPTLTIGSGSSTSDAEVLTLTAVGGYSGTITMACANLPSGSTCSFQPPTVSVSAATSPVNVVMTIQNSGTSTAASLGMHSAIMHDTTLAAIFWIPGLFASALIGKKRKLLFQARFLLLLLLLGGVFGGLTGCGSSSYTAITQAVQTTPFQVMVTGTGNVTQTISLTVTVQ